jgi:hypothetical protein
MMYRAFLIVCVLVSIAAVGFFVLRASAASVVIDGAVDVTTTQHNASSPQTVFVATSTGYAFFVDSTNTCVYRKTHDGGVSWGNAVTVDAQTDCEKIAVWYDQWTPGDTGVNIHIATIDIDQDDIFYTQLNTSNDNVSATVNITSGSSYVGVFTTAVNVPTITKATDGALYASVLDLSDSIVVRCTTTCTTNTNWIENSPTWTLGDDVPILVPLASGNIMLIQWDISADDILSKVFTVGSLTWDGAWTNIEINAADNTTYDAAFGAAISHASNNVYLVAADDVATLGGADDDIKTWRYTGGAWAARTDAVTNSACAGGAICGILDATVAVDQYSGDVYVIYAARSNSATVSSANVYWKRSANEMSTWGSEQGGLDSATGDYYGGASASFMGPRIYARWYESAVDDLSGETILLSALTVATSGTQVANIEIGTTNQYVGGTFVFTHDTSSSTVQSIMITETGTVDAQSDFDNIRLFWENDTVAPLDCASVSYGGTESQFGSTDTDGFSSANGTSTFTGSLSVSTTTALCVYAVVDVLSSATNDETLDIQITSPNPDVTISRGAVLPNASVRALGGVTTLEDDVLTQTHYHWRNDDDTETAATSATAGAEDTAISSYPVNGVQRLRVQVSNEGATSSAATNYRIEYAPKVTTCAEGSYVDVGAVGGDWDMYDSTHITDGANTTNIPVGDGGVSNENTTFLTPNGGVKDTSSQTGALTLTETEYVELEYALIASTTASSGSTYCFRVSSSGTDLAVYTVYAEATIGADVYVSAIGTQTASSTVPTTDEYVGGAFVLTEQASSRNVTSITVTETGTVNAATGLDNIRLFYESDTAAPYDCASEAYDGVETQYGSTDTDGFSSANGSSTFTQSVGVTLTSTLCVYVVLDVTVTAGNGTTLEIEIADPTVDVTVSGGGSTSPSSPVSLPGSTTLEEALLTLTHYHFRADDGTETTATSLTGGVDDTPISRVNKNEIKRLRVQVSNEGLATSTGGIYRLEYGERSSTCAAIGTWIEVGALGGAFDIANSTNLTHGADTTNIAEASGGMPNENTDFETPNAGVRDTSGDSGALTLDATDYVELEYAFEATDSALDATSYCFRLTLQGVVLYAYTVYPTLTTEAANDFLVQRNVTTIAAGQTVATITAGVDYIAPKSTSSAFIRITNSQHTGAGHNVGGGNGNALDVTANIGNPDNLLTSINFQRAGTTNTTRIAWEIVEYIGPAGGDNEMKVRMASSTLFSAIGLGATTTVTGVVDDTDVVVWVTGSRNPDTAAADYNTMLVTSEWVSATDQAALKRQEASGDAIAVSWAAVEYTGSNWRVQRVSHTYTTAGINEFETLVTTLGSTTMAFVHTQRRTGANIAGTDEFGHEVFINSTTQVGFQIQSGATSPTLQTSVAWVIENRQSTGVTMNVQRVANPQTGGVEPLATNVSIPASITATTTASIFINNRNDNTGTTFPRPIIGARIISGTQFELWNSDTGLTRNYRVEIVTWPTAVRTQTQNYYRFYVDNDALDPTDPWDTNLGENTSITAINDPIGTNELIRIRMSVTVRGASLAASSTAYRLQYGTRDTTCSAITNWLSIGDTSSTTAPWRGYNASPTSGTALSGNPPTPSDLNLSVSDRAGTYEEGPYSAPNPHKIYIGEDVEYDWILERNTAPDFTTYCFRMVELDESTLDAYSFYPTLITAGFLVETGNWRFYNDETSLTPTTALANENIAPTNVAFDNALKLRVTAAEIGGANGLPVKFKLQFSEQSDFSSGVLDVTEIGSCVASDLWCFADGAGVDNATTTAKVLTDSGSCVATVGSGCGAHNESGTSSTTSAFLHLANAAAEYEFTIRNAGARVNTVYYFRLYDDVLGVAVDTSGTYPSLTTEGATLTFTIAGLSSGSVTEGVTTDVTTTAIAAPFGLLAFDTEAEAAQRMTVTTNATGGYRVYAFTRQGFVSGGADIDPIGATNAVPASWATGCGSNSCFGYHAGDDVLAGNNARFAPEDTYAAFTSTLAEVAYSGVPISGETTDMIYKLELSAGQEGGDYTASIVYIAVPVF